MRTLLSIVIAAMSMWSFGSGVGTGLPREAVDEFRKFPNVINEFKDDMNKMPIADWLGVGSIAADKSGGLPARLGVARERATRFQKEVKQLTGKIFGCLDGKNIDVCMQMLECCVELEKLAALEIKFYESNIEVVKFLEANRGIWFVDKKLIKFKEGTDASFVSKYTALGGKVADTAIEIQKLEGVYLQGKGSTLPVPKQSDLDGVRKQLQTESWPVAK